MRLDKLFSNLGLLSRSEAKAAVKKGRVTVNGVVASGSDMKIDPDKDEICLDGKRIIVQQFVYYMFNKPSGVITANDDRTSPVVMDYIRDTRPDLSAVGRLDKDTTGILLITNDGELNHRLLSPRNHVSKTYQVWIDGELTEDDMVSLTEGMDIGDDKPTLPARVRVINTYSGEIEISKQLHAMGLCSDEIGHMEQSREHEIYKDGIGISEEIQERSMTIQHVELIITEGRYHQVKRMFARLGKPVVKLHRSGFGPLELDAELKPGEYRELTEDEKQNLYRN